MKRTAILMMILFTCLACREQAGYEGKDISENMAILRNKDSKQAFLRIDLDTDWILYAGPSVEKIDLKTPLASGQKSGIYELDVPLDKRSYFQLVTPDSKVIIAESHLPMAGGFNLRDLGGLAAAGGRHIQWGKLFRSDELHNLTPEDLAYLSAIPLVSIVDFRSEEEIKQSTDKKPASLKNHYEYSIQPGSLSPEIISKSGKFQDKQMDTFMMALNEELVSNPEFIERYRAFFALLQDESKIPLLFHCSAGKDRTGMAAALILYALGVD